MRYIIESQFVYNDRASLHQVAEALIGLLEELAERQKYDMLAIAVDVICIFRCSMRISRALEDPLLSSYDVNQFYLAIAFPSCGTKQSHPGGKAL